MIKTRMDAQTDMPYQVHICIEGPDDIISKPYCFSALKVTEPDK